MQVMGVAGAVGRMAAATSIAPYPGAAPRGGQMGGQGISLAQRGGHLPKEKARRSLGSAGFLNSGGAKEDRTPDLVIANDALSQLSYGPTARPV